MDTEKTVGTLLREARLGKGLSLAEAEQATSIRARYLEAIEKDEYEKTPGEVFLKGMLRNYGNFLGLDGLELVHMYKASAVGKPKDAVKSTGIREVDKVKLNIQLKNPRDVGSGTGKLELPKLPSIDMRQVLAGVAVLVVLAGGYFAIPKAIDYFQNRPQAVAAVEKKEEPSAKKPAAADKVQVNLEATGDCWLEVQAEGKEIFAGMLKAKDKKTFETKEKLIVKYGNIGVVKIVFNGEPVDLQGQHGVQVKTYTLQGTQDESKYAPPAKPEAQGSVQEKTEPTEAKADKAEAGAAKPAEPVKAEAKAEKVETVEAKPAEAKPVEAKQ